VDADDKRDQDLPEMQKRLLEYETKNAAGPEERDTSMKETKKQHRRARGSGSVYPLRKVWWIAYRGADGLRCKESTGSTRKGDAERLLERRVGSREHNLPVIKNAEQITFNDAAKAVVTVYENNSKPSTVVLKRRIAKHLMPYFTGKRLAGITASVVNSYIAYRKQQGIVAWDGKQKGERIRDVSNSEINRELGTLKLIFNHAIRDGKLGSKPHIAMLKEAPACQGFFERDQMTSVLKHLPQELAAVVEFAYITGWRVASEVIPMQWRQVDFKAGDVRLDAGTTKNGDGRVVYLTAGLRRLLKQQHELHQQLAKTGQIVPHVFFKMVAKKRGGEKFPRPIGSFKRAWMLACRAAGVPGKKLHDLRRTAVRDLDRAGVSRTVAMKMVGHRTESIYNRYNITSDVDLREAARKLDVAAGRK
jgi:integrase